MRREPASCADMAELRAEIDRLDAEIVGLLDARRGYIARAAEIKRAAGLPARIGERVEEVVARVRAEAAARDLDPALVEALWRRLIDWSIALEERALSAEGKDP
ncbi:chorismate mutase [Amaricoccus sp.]|uniref:chorismate mutase n=1 Tax=Amaricoccus sp. TaxID=1872485 RepID=UPI0026214BDE|nr:chorismate mutase [uncultured Amaricoccus sp.]